MQTAPYVPHDKPKQLHGSELLIIGFLVDTVNLRISIPDDTKALLLGIIEWFKASKHRTLAEFQHLTGYLNWALNVLHWLKPALRPLYEKMRNKSRPKAKIFVNNAVRKALSWFATRFDQHNGITLMESLAWDDRDADMIIYTDASLEGFGFFSPTHNIGFYGSLPEPGEGAATTIFYYEAYAIVAAIDWASRLQQKPRRLTIFTDSMNSCDIFNSLSAGPKYNRLLIRSAEIVLVRNIDIRVQHIPGDSNVIADALSRFKPEVAKELVPTIDIQSFIPPPRWLGDEWC